MRVSHEKRERQQTYYYTKIERVILVFQQMTLSSQLGAVETFQTHTIKADIY